ncbi:hypothetical protein BXT86_05450 [candidate division WOR-3 bacterium 4484_100]|uniref:Methyl-accepting chemotaxis protein n=1 Tax=candidate division WOR-3 bacterium 4484_100 TaxID=1936077 RepID=A0A1V4QE72_UNCW3|nr:MAG: hypothetical protein BXT86_05450 [candidate division WOR-3 bacterium 4484_100]
MNSKGEGVIERNRNFAFRGSVVFMASCIAMEIVFLLGYIFKFLIVPGVVPIITAIGFIFGLLLTILCKKKIMVSSAPYILTTGAMIFLTVCLGFLDPIARIPFFLIYIYIIIIPTLYLGVNIGIYNTFLFDLAYIIMVFITRPYYLDTHIEVELVKVAILTFIIWVIISHLGDNIERLRKISDATLKAADGDLTIRIRDEKGDEVSRLAHSLNLLFENELAIVRAVISIADNLSEMSEHIASTANELSASSSEIVHSTQQFAGATNEQFDELNKTIGLSKNLSEVNFNVVGNVKKIEDFSVGVSDNASNGLKQSDIVINNIELIREKYDYLNSLMKKLQDISSTINRIVITINAIAEKINILALNASIEAARAGEYGRGFSIVADEISRLADSSQESASEISKIMNEMMSSIETVSQGTEEVNKSITDGSIVIRSTVDSLKDISNRVLQLNSAIKDIKKVISNEEEVITEITKQVERSYNIARQNSEAAEEILSSLQEQAAASEEFSATSEELVSVANRLKQIIEHFKIQSNSNQ